MFAVWFLHFPHLLMPAGFFPREVLRGFRLGRTVLKTFFEFVANVEPLGDFHVIKTKPTTNRTV